MGACREEDEEEEVVYVGISVRGRERDRCSGGNVCNCVISAGKGRICGYEKLLISHHSRQLEIKL